MRMGARSGPCPALPCVCVACARVSSSASSLCLRLRFRPSPSPVQPPAARASLLPSGFWPRRAGPARISGHLSVLSLPRTRAARADSDSDSDWRSESEWWLQLQLGLELQLESGRRCWLGRSAVDCKQLWSRRLLFAPVRAGARGPHQEMGRAPRWLGWGLARHGTLEGRRRDCARRKDLG